MMKDILRKLAVVAFMVYQFLGNNVTAQVSAYSFAQSSEVYAEITGGTVLGTATGNGVGNPSLDDLNFSIPDGSFPFGFNFNGVNYTGCNVNTNGYITFGATLPAAGSPYTPISNTVAYQGAIAAWARDLNAPFNVAGRTGNIRWEVVGTAPNREVVIQWKDFRPRYTTSTTDAYTFTFQIRLQENGYKVVVTHLGGGIRIGAPTTNGTIQVGLRGASNTDYNNRTNTTTVNFNLSTAGTSNAATQAFNVSANPPGTPDSLLTYTWTPVACTGSPTAGTTQSSVADSVCPNVNFNLSLSGASQGYNLVYQWISSTDGVSYVNESGNQALFQTSITSDKYYRAIVSCPTTGLQDTSSVYFIKVKNFLNCYCGAPFNGTVNTVDIVTKVVLKNATGDSLVQTSASNGSNNYDIYNNTPLDLQAGTTATLDVSYGTDGTQYGAAWIDYNRNGIFEANENVALTTTSSGGSSTVSFSFILPINASVGLTRMRVRGGSDAAYTAAGACSVTSFGETEDYLVNLISASNCINPPVAGTISGNKATLCSGDSALFSLSGNSQFTTIQWQVSSDSIVWTDIIGADGITYNTGALSTVKYYRAKIVCLDSSFTNALSVKQNPVTDCYCVPPSTSCSLSDVITNVTLNYINNSTTCSVGGYSFYTSLVDTIYAGANNSISVTVDNGGTEYVGVWIDYNQNGVFDSLEYTPIGSIAGGVVTNFINVPNGATIGNTRMRVRVRFNTALEGDDACIGYSYGETEDYLVYVAPAPPCSTPTVGGTIAGSSSVNAFDIALFTLNGYTGQGTLWEIASAPTGPFTNLGVNNDSLTLYLNALGTYYLRVLVSEIGCTESYSDTFAFTIVQPGDEPCDAIPLVFGQNGPYTMELATTSPNEVRPGEGDCDVQTGWCNSTLSNTLWFKFVAPASGRVLLRAPGMDAQIALWKVDTCSFLADSTLGNFVLIAANDDDPNYLANNVLEYSPVLDSIECLVPGATYYVQLDPYDDADASDTTSVILIDKGIIDASFTGLSSDVYCELASGEILTPVNSGGVFAGPGVDNGNEFVPSLAGVGGPYFITHTLFGCYTFTDTVSVSGNPVVDSVEVKNLECFGDSSGEVEVYFSNGALPFSYLWSNGEQGSSIEDLPAGTYSVTVTTADGCLGISNSYDVTEPAAALEATVVVTDVACLGGNNGSATVTALNGTPIYSYDWSNSSSNSSTVSSLSAGVFTVVVTDANGCSLSLSDTVSQPSTGIQVSTVSSDVDCFGDTDGSVVANVTGGAGNYSYSWTGSAATGNSISVGSGVYSVTVTDGNQCTAVATDTVNQPANALSVSAVVTDQVGSTSGAVNVTVSGGTPTYSYQWSNAANTEDITVNAGVYTLTVTDSKGCTFVLQDTVDFINGITSTEIDVRRMVLYPNPTAGVSNLVIELTTLNDVQIELYDVTGKLLNSIFRPELISETIRLDYSDYAAGIYTVRIKVKDSVFSKQVVVQR